MTIPTENKIITYLQLLEGASRTSAEIAYSLDAADVKRITRDLSEHRQITVKRDQSKSKTPRYSITPE
jgi:hypothetical protein